jgi:succinate dehydrogenase / fumarate reductase flavoprotein subunit
VGIAGHRQYNNGWHTAIDLASLLLVSEAITRAALLRKESRGAQFREDFPNKDPNGASTTSSSSAERTAKCWWRSGPLPPMPDELQAVIQGDEIGRCTRE